MKSFTFGKRGIAMLSLVASLLLGGVSPAWADYSITGPSIIESSSGWTVASGRWNVWGSGIYDYAGGNDLSNTDVISPLMAKPKDGQKLVVNGNNNGGTTSVLKIYYSYDKSTWTLAKDLSADMNATTGSAVDMVAEFEVEGDFYVRMECNKVFIISVTISDYTPAMGVYTSSSASSETASGKTTDFDLVTEAPTYTYYVKNTDRGVLTVEADATGGYTVSPATLSLGAGEQQAITVTAPSKGYSEGTLTITGKNGDEVIKTFTANFKGDVMDKENTFFEDFNGTSLTAVKESDLPGWEKDVTVHDGAEDYAGSMQYYNDNGTTVVFYYVTGDEDKAAYLITPKLHAGGSKMYVRSSGLSDGKLSVYYSADKESWTLVKAYSTTSYVQNSFALPEGDWYVKFELWDATIDWVYGYTLAPEAEALTLDQDNAPEALTAGECDVTLNYTIAEGKWGTIALPFAVENVSVLGDVKVWAFTGYENGDINLEKTPTMEAGKPYVIYANTAITEPIKLNNVNITATKAAVVENGDAKFQATYAPMTAGQMEGKYGVTPAGKIQKGSAKATMKGFRGYFELPANTNNARLIIGGDVVTGIDALESTETTEVVFDLQGRRVAQPAKGLYIVGGKKVVK